MAEPSPLRQAFLEDHRDLTQGLTRLLAALRDADGARATQIADELDRTVGPHMEFEEHIFYPELAKLLGRDFVSGLYHEHALGKRAIHDLVARDPGEPIAEQERDVLAALVETALEHALSCGTMLSHVEALDVGVQRALYERLLEIRRNGTRWSKLRRSDDPEPDDESGERP